MDNSSSSHSQMPNSSSAIPTDNQAWNKVLVNNSKPKTPAQIKAAGDVSVKIGVLWLVGIVCGLLGTFGCVAFFVIPDSAKDLWVIVGPIITAGLTGTLAYLTGEKNGSGK
jgi:H+/Cl- antiporter ClcA